MPPYNMTREEMLFAVSGGALVALSSSLFYFIFGKLLNKAFLIRHFLGLKYSYAFAIQATVLAGIIFSAALLKELYHEHFISFWPFDPRSFDAGTDAGLLVVSGLLVGFGAVLSGGCTFGHGVVGVPRLDLGSILSVAIFSASAYYTNKWNIAGKFPTEASQKLSLSLPHNVPTDYFIDFLFLVPFVLYVLSKDKSLVGLAKFFLAFLIGNIAGIGMMIGGVAQRSLVLRAFVYDRNWDPTILVFFATAVLINLFVFMFVIKRKYVFLLLRITPVFATQVDNPTNKLSFSLLLGSVCFGVGWGLAGLCPGPFLLLVPLKSLTIPFYWGLSLCAGIKIAELFNAVFGKIGQKSGNDTVPSVA